MRTYDELKTDMAERPRVRIENQATQRGWDWCRLGAIIGLSGGIITTVMGSVLTVITWFTATGVGNSYVRTMGTILLIMTIPLLILGAHCLDLAEKQAEKARKPPLSWMSD